MYKLHEKIVQEIAPSEQIIKQYFELEDFVPHLTLGKLQYGLSRSELTLMEDLVDKELTPYPTFQVDYIRIYRSNNNKTKYEPYLDIHLNN